MAIQGIIFGFMNPSKPECNMLLLGRGEAYELVIDGERVDVRGAVTDAMGHLRVTEWGTATFENSISYIAVDHDGGSDAPPASRERGESWPNVLFFPARNVHVRHRGMLL